MFFTFSLFWMILVMRTRILQRMKACLTTSLEGTIPCMSGKFAPKDYNFLRCLILCFCFLTLREVLINRYLIIQKLGWGHFSTVWLAKDI